jgi:hypothetical protein
MMIPQAHTRSSLLLRSFALLCLPLLLLLQGCDIDKREKALEKRSAELKQWEETLLLRENDLKLKEEELAQRARNRDSSARDSAFIYNPALIGSWAVQMTCTETTCAGSAVGDTKTEQWDISYQDNHVIAKALVGRELQRVYRGLYTGNTLELVEDRAVANGQPATRMIVRLRMVSNRTLEGQREIVREGECKIIYALQMEKQQNAPI